MAEYARFGAISCTHCPYQSERAIAKLLEELKGRKLTHFIHCGDVVDAEAASVHNADEPVGHTLVQEYARRCHQIASWCCWMATMMTTFSDPTAEE